MLHPLLRLVATRPDLLTDHAQAYAELVGDELGRSLAHWRERAMYAAIAAALGVAGLVFAGVALMLWAVTPDAQLAARGWLLVATPAVPLVAALGCWLRSRTRPLDKPFDVVKQQVAADLVMLREVSRA